MAHSYWDHGCLAPVGSDPRNVHGNADGIDLVDAAGFVEVLSVDGQDLAGSQCIQVFCFFLFCWLYIIVLLILLLFFTYYG